MQSLSTQEPLTLTDLVRKFAVSFRVLPGYVKVADRETEVGLELELKGSHEPVLSHPEDGCPACRRVLLALFELADWLLPIEKAAFKGEAAPYEKLTRYRPEHTGEREVVLAIKITCRRPFARAFNGWALRFLEDVSRALEELGCRESYQPDQAPFPTGPAEPLTRDAVLLRSKWTCGEAAL